jgi:hypothetical protein
VLLVALASFSGICGCHASMHVLPTVTTKRRDSADTVSRRRRRDRRGHKTVNRFPRCLRCLCSSRFSRRVKPEPELRLQFRKGQKSGRRADMCIYELRADVAEGRQSR